MRRSGCRYIHPVAALLREYGSVSGASWRETRVATAALINWHRVTAYLMCCSPLPGPVRYRDTLSQRSSRPVVKSGQPAQMWPVQSDVGTFLRDTLGGSPPIQYDLADRAMHQFIAVKPPKRVT